MTSTTNIKYTNTVANIGSVVQPSQSKLTTTRALNTTYAGSSTKSTLVMVTVRCSISLAAGMATAQAKSDGTTTPTTIASGIVGIQTGLMGEDNSFQISFTVAAGMNYRLDTTATNGAVVLGEWFETTF